MHTSRKQMNAIAQLVGVKRRRFGLEPNFMLRKRAQKAMTANVEKPLHKVEDELRSGK